MHAHLRMDLREGHPLAWRDRGELGTARRIGDAGAGAIRRRRPDVLALGRSRDEAVRGADAQLRIGDRRSAIGEVRAHRRALAKRDAQAQLPANHRLHVEDLATRAAGSFDAQVAGEGHDGKRLAHLARTERVQLDLDRRAEASVAGHGHVLGRVARRHAMFPDGVAVFGGHDLEHQPGVRHELRAHRRPRGDASLVPILEPRMAHGQLVRTRSETGELDAVDRSWDVDACKLDACSAQRGAWVVLLSEEQGSKALGVEACNDAIVEPWSRIDELDGRRLADAHLDGLGLGRGLAGVPRLQSQESHGSVGQGEAPGGRIQLDLRSMRLAITVVTSLFAWIDRAHSPIA